VAIVLLDVGLEVVGVSNRSETWRQCGKAVIAMSSPLLLT
jgi:hypothetical protein